MIRSGLEVSRLIRRRPHRHGLFFSSSESRSGFSAAAGVGGREVSEACVRESEGRVGGGGCVVE